MRKIIAIVMSALVLIPIAANADLTSVNSNIVIIDTGYDASVTKLSSNIVSEACFTNIVPSCPNGTNFQEGAGSAALNPAQLRASTADHGTQMLSASSLINPNTKFIFVRAYSIAGMAVYSPTDTDFYLILNWLYANKDKLNIGAVVFSAARPTTNCATFDALTQKVNDFKSAGIPIFSAAGNNYDSINVAFPACLKPIIAVGSIDNYPWMSNWHSNYSNAGAALDFDALGNMVVTTAGNKSIQAVGTSIAAQVAAASWVAIHQAKPMLSYAQEYSLIKQTATFSSNAKVKNVPTLSLAGALKP